jgi:hypothetical protein
MVERTLAWLNCNRRLAQDLAATIASAETWLLIASVKLMVRRLARAQTMIVNYESNSNTHVAGGSGRPVVLSRQNQSRPPAPDSY